MTDYLVKQVLLIIFVLGLDVGNLLLQTPNLVFHLSHVSRLFSKPARKKLEMSNTKLCSENYLSGLLSVDKVCTDFEFEKHKVLFCKPILTCQVIGQLFYLKLAASSSIVFSSKSSKVFPWFDPKPWL